VWAGEKNCVGGKNEENKEKRQTKGGVVTGWK
jgi:hypothetical protein